MNQVTDRNRLAWPDRDLLEKTWREEAGGGRSVQQSFNWDKVGDAADLASELRMLQREMVLLLDRGYDVKLVDQEHGVLWVKDDG